MALSKDRLISSDPSNFSPAAVDISHLQLRDLLICPREQGLVCYVQKDKIVEHDITVSDSRPHTLADLKFTPNTLTSLSDVAGEHTLIAAGGQEAEVFLSLLSPSHPTTFSSSRYSRRSRPLWKYETKVPGSINNSVLLTRSNTSALEPRIVVSNNDRSVKMYDIPLHVEDEAPTGLVPNGVLTLPVCVNHSSISPDGRILLSVGDSSQVYINSISGSSRTTFSHIKTLDLPPTPSSNVSPHPPACFSTAFSSDGTKFAVGSQDGCVVVWDIRSSKPLKTYWTTPRKERDTLRSPSPVSMFTAGDIRWNYTRGPLPIPVPILASPPLHMHMHLGPIGAGECRALSCGIRSVKFSSAGWDTTGNDSHQGLVKEVMVFTEHANMIHIVDARTFEEETIVEMPIGASASSMDLRRRLRRSARSQSPIPRRAFTPDADADDNDSSITPIGRRYASTSRRSSPLPVYDIGGRSPWSPPAGMEVYADFTDDETADPRQSITISAADPDCATDDEDGDVSVPLLTAATPSRDTTSSPHPSEHAMHSNTSVYSSRINLSSRIRRPMLGRRHTDASLPSAQRRTPPHLSSLNTDMDMDLDLDLAGVCFDPSGKYLYVASTHGVAEWYIRDANKIWWSQTDCM